MEQETTQGPGRGGNRDPGAETEDITAGTRTHTQEGHATTKGPARPHPQRAPHDPRGCAPNTCHQSAYRTPYGSHQRTPTSHRNPHRG